MYSNPSMFAPKVRANGGEAYPQAPTMNQFFDYGHPTPQVPFVFQTGGMMDFSGEKSTRRSNFLNKFKEASNRWSIRNGFLKSKRVGICTTTI
jgi:hypothetical protein